jgi:hypothetical protein
MKESGIQLNGESNGNKIYRCTIEKNQRFFAGKDPAGNRRLGARKFEETDNYHEFSTLRRVHFTFDNSSKERFEGSLV